MVLIRIIWEKIKHSNTQHCYSAAALPDWGDAAKAFCRETDARNVIKLHLALFFPLFLLSPFILSPAFPFAEHTLPSRSPVRNTSHAWCQQGQGQRRRAFSDSRDGSLSPQAMLGRWKGLDGVERGSAMLKPKVQGHNVWKTDYDW